MSDLNLPVYEPFDDDRAAAIEILRALVGERISIQTGGNHQHRRGVLAAFHEAEGVLELTSGKRTVLPSLDTAFVSDSEPILGVREALVSFDLLGARGVSVYRDVEPEPQPEPEPEFSPGHDEIEDEIFSREPYRDRRGAAVAVASIVVLILVGLVFANGPDASSVEAADHQQWCVDGGGRGC